MATMADCVFCAIVRGERPADEVWRGGGVLVFLDTRPLARGHCLVVPELHVATLLDLPDRLCGPLLQVTRRTAGAVERALGCAGSLVAVNVKVSQSVPHLHVHVVPRRRRDLFPLRLLWPYRYRGDADRRGVARRLRDVMTGAEER